MTDSRELIRQIEELIAQLPTGYISKKNLNNKIRYYRQWKEAGKVKANTSVRMSWNRLPSRSKNAKSPKAFTGTEKEVSGPSEGFGIV